MSLGPKHPFKLPQRSSRPRQQGITHVIDTGLTAAQASDLVAAAGECIDFLKLGFGTALVTKQLTEKIAIYSQAEIPVLCGGTLTEVAIAQNKLSEFTQWLKELGIKHVEISDGVVELPQKEKLSLVEQLANDFTVFVEIGSKDKHKIMAPYRWVEQIQDAIAAGAWRVIAEARESGTVGIFRSSGEVRMGLIDEIVHAIDPKLLIFEAPKKDQQVWFIKRLGSEVNLGNIAPADVIALEALRLGLRSDTFELATE